MLGVSSYDSSKNTAYVTAINDASRLHKGVVFVEKKPHVIAGRNINRLRVSKKLTQEALLEIAGIDFRSLHRIEAGSWNMAVDYVERFERALRCKLRDLIRGLV